MSLVLDSTLLADLRKGKPEAQALIRETAEEGALLLVPSIVIAEVLAGSADPAEDLARIRDHAEILDFSEGDARAAAALAREALMGGRFPGWNDVLIAGFALNRGAEAIVTRNSRHFPGVRIRGY